MADRFAKRRLYRPHCRMQSSLHSQVSPVWLVAPAQTTYIEAPQAMERPDLKIVGVLEEEWYSEVISYCYAKYFNNYTAIFQSPPAACDGYDIGEENTAPIVVMR